MRVAWVSHQWPNADGSYIGGAEFIQHEMRMRAPDHLEIVPVRPGEVGDPSLFDRVVVVGFELLRPNEVSALEGHVDVMWLMSPPEKKVENLMGSARTLVWASDGMRQHFGWGHGESLSGSWDTSQVPTSADKEDVAVWAARDVYQKGRHNAREWAIAHDVPLQEFSGQPRHVVLEAMAKARWFVHLPTEVFDPCPTTVIEAELAGCELVVNHLVGRVPVSGRNEIIRHIESNGVRFWQWVCD